MNTQQNSRSRYSLSSESSRWWLPSAAVGFVATAATAAIIAASAPGTAIPIPDGYAGTGTGSGPVHAPVQAPEVAESPVLPEGWHHCFMWRANWNTALDGPQPLCSDGDRAGG